MPGSDPVWSLVGFGERMDAWIDLEEPQDDLRIAVASWALSRFDDPYQGVRREPGFENLWYGVIPGTQHGDNQVVVCSYWIEERTHVVRCDSIATLALPA